MRPWIVAVAALAACAPTTPRLVAPTGPSLMPSGTAIAVQSRTRARVVTGRLVHIDAREVVVLADGAHPGALSVARSFAREDVLALYRRPGGRLGIGFIAGAAAGVALGVLVGAELCDRGSLPDCSRSFYRSSRNRDLVRVGGAIVGALIVGSLGHELDRGARGLDPSDWQEIRWP